MLLRDPYVTPRVVDPEPDRRIVVLAPHADDEAIGCGGAVLLHRRVGCRVTVVYVTDGTMGDARLHRADIDDARKQEIREWLHVTRRAEASRWCAAAGVGAPLFLDGPDGRLGTEQERMAGMLASELEALDPDIIYLPSLLDAHPDHVATNVIVAMALATPRLSALRDRVRLRGFEVWNPLVVNMLVDISSVNGRKLELLALYESQVRDIDYGRAVNGLGAYRAMRLPGHAGHAEAFIELDAEHHARLLKPGATRR